MVGIPSANSDLSAMSDYERDAWQALLAEVDKQHHQSHRFEDWTRGIRKRARDTAEQARRRVPAADAAIEAVEAAITASMQGLQSVLVERGLNSVTPAGIFAMFDGVASYDDVRALDLGSCDASVPQRKDRYVALAATEGAASSLAVSGGVLSAVVTGGSTALLAVSAIAADVTTVMVGMGRIVAVVAAHYGYDVREPDEEVLASGVIAYAAAGTSEEKAATLASLSRLTAQLSDARGELPQRQMVSVAQKVFSSLGYMLVRSKLAQAIPVVGAVLNGGFNARLAHLTFTRAQQVYRLRFLTEKYGLDAARWAPPAVAGETVQVPLVDEVLRATLDSASD